MVDGKSIGGRYEPDWWMDQRSNKDNQVLGLSMVELDKTHAKYEYWTDAPRSKRIYEDWSIAFDDTPTQLRLYQNYDAQVCSCYARA